MKTYHSQTLCVVVVVVTEWAVIENDCGFSRLVRGIWFYPIVSIAIILDGRNAGWRLRVHVTRDCYRMQVVQVVSVIPMFISYGFRITEILKVFWHRNLRGTRFACLVYYTVAQFPSGGL